MVYEPDISSGSNDVPEFLRIENWDSCHPGTKHLWPESFIESERRRAHWCRLQNFTRLAIEFVLDGNLCFEQNGVTDIVGPGETYLVRRPEESLMKTGPAAHYKKIALVVRGSLLESVLSSMGLDKKFKIKLSAPSEIERLMREIGELITTKRVSDISRVTGLTLELLSRLSADASEDDETPPELAAAIHLMEASTTRRLSAEELAKAAKCSVSTLNRRFRERLKMSPHAYLTRLRMDYAALLLSSSGLRIKEVADRLAYRNQMYFSSDFKRHFKMSPSELRRRGGPRPGERPPSKLI